MEHHNGVVPVEVAADEAAADLLEDDGGGGGGVVNEGDVVHVAGIDEVLDGGA